MHEAPLVRALVTQGRRFVKPLRYDARTVAGFANAILLDVGAAPVDLHVVSGFMGEADQGAKRRAFENARPGPGSGCWRGHAGPARPLDEAHRWSGGMQAACGPTTVRPNPRRSGSWLTITMTLASISESRLRFCSTDVSFPAG